MKKILIILVGGTICCEENEKGNLEVGSHGGSALINGFKNSSSEYKDSAEFVCSENLFILSENMTVNNWNRIIKTYKDCTENAAFDGVIFAHGTDTLGFSAALFAQLLCNEKWPVFFVSAQKPLSDPLSNGHANFKCAVECILKGVKNGVWVAYKNISDNTMYIHNGAALRQCENYSDDFLSFNMQKEDNFKFESVNSKTDIPLDIPLENNVLLIESYVGIDYSAYDLSRFKAVLHTTYHSGTACAEKNENGEYTADSFLYLIDACKKSKVDLYLCPAENKKGTYQTVDTIFSHGDVNFLYGYTKETAYAKLLIAYSVFENEKDRK